MTQEEKELLLSDICARLPYGVIVNCNREDEMLFAVTERGFLEVNDRFLLEDCKPYLRPMSSMTEEENVEYLKTLRVIQDEYLTPHWCDTLSTFDWLNAHHFDYRGLIPMGLALEAPEGMYKTE